MILKTVILPSVVVGIILLTLVPLRALDRGPIAAFSCSPFGSGYLSVPGPDGNRGDSAKPKSDSRLTSATRLYLSGGYYYDYLQADLSYTRTWVDRQISDFGSGTDLKSGADSSLMLRGGYRFSIPGDTSYSWFYLGLKRYDFSSIRGTDVTAYGWLVGYSGFYSIGLSSDYEFVIALDLYAGTYRLDRFLSDNGYAHTRKRYSVIAGGGLGAGVQCEPYNVTLLLKLSADINRIAYDAQYQGHMRKFSTGMASACLGLEVRYAVPSERYNDKTR
ncbi:MAG TPA: hypothetical protein PKK43_06860 [Spirochaetota bacterium]|nr:hypothetical protein [Spirochaetota bacterium]